jgi:putative membrane-bound dehydrogenase-like protein
MQANRERRLAVVALAAFVVCGSGGMKLVPALGAGPPATGAPGQSGLFPLSPQQSLACARVAPGFEVELFAAEPNLASPVAMVFDADGDVYVAEMLDYPIIRTPGMFGPFPEGQIRLLRTGERGEVVGSSVFATAVAAPTSVLPYDGGVLVSAAPDILFLKDTDGDGHADVRKVVLTGFDTRQDLYRLNSLFWGVDGWIYARGVGDTPIHWGDDPKGPALSTGGMNFRFRPWERKLEPVSGMSSCFGLTTDDLGHLFFSNSASHVYQVVFPDRYLKRNPYLAAPPLTTEISDHGGVARVFRISRPQPWRVERSEFWEKTGLTKKYFGQIEPRQDYMTATCGPLVYREAAFPAEYSGNYFVCEAVSNLVHRDLLKGPGPVFRAARADPGREFFASADNWCCPVYLQAGPDGAVYVVDMYRQIIEHAGPDGGRDVPNVPVEILQKYGLRAGSTTGRIYRIAPSGVGHGAKSQMTRAAPRVLARSLASPSAWWRSSAQRLILTEPTKADVAAITPVARQTSCTAARVQALWTLDALGQFDRSLVLAALHDGSPGVRENALRIAESRFSADPELVSAVLGMAGEPDPMVRFQLALTLGEVPSARRLEALAEVARRGASEPYLRSAVLSSAGDFPLELYRALATGEQAPGIPELCSEAARVIGARLNGKEIERLLDVVASQRREQVAEVLRALAAGIRSRGRKTLDLPGARAKLIALAGYRTDTAARAAAELQASIRLLTPHERESLIARASAAVTAEDRPLDERMKSIEALGTVDAPAALSVLELLLRPQVAEPLQIAALDALAEQSGPGVVKVLAGAWTSLPPTTQSRAIEVALGRKDRLGPLVEAISAGKIPAAAFGGAERARLLATSDKGVADTAATVFGKSVRLDPGLFDKARPALDLKGDPARGAVTFKKVCVTCHRVDGEGTDVGPNLASVRNHPREQILRDILYPSLSLSPQYHQYVVATADGRMISGLLSGSSATSYSIRKQGGEEVVVLRKDVEELRDTGVSLMPEKLLDGLGPQEISDLLEFVKRAE